MRKRTLLAVSFLLCFFANRLTAAGSHKAEDSHTTPAMGEYFENAVYQNHSPNVFFHQLRQRAKNTKKITAAVLAFPIPFGFFGCHRIYLGAKPLVPVVYIATLGGCFGILPLIDFAVIVFSKDIEKYERNSKIFMWNTPSEN